MTDWWKQKIKGKNDMFISAAEIISIQSCTLHSENERIDTINISHTDLENQFFNCNVNHIIDLSPIQSKRKTSHYKTLHSSEPNGTNILN